mmetsp:Transcript_20294/g.50733  ORF Transcript_20294/g.50733 Transcript_20294/m.50733 type:complete len:206 (+) Transcript_20294:587-1204(+)
MFRFGCLGGLADARDSALRCHVVHRGHGYSQRHRGAAAARRLLAALYRWGLGPDVVGRPLPAAETASSAHLIAAAPRAKPGGLAGQREAAPHGAGAIGSLSGHHHLANALYARRHATGMLALHLSCLHRDKLDDSSRPVLHRRAVNRLDVFLQLESNEHILREDLPRYCDVLWLLGSACHHLHCRSSRTCLLVVALKARIVDDRA